jgi:hypothetical protein
MPASCERGAQFFEAHQRPVGVDPIERNGSSPGSTATVCPHSGEARRAGLVATVLDAM